MTDRNIQRRADGCQWYPVVAHALTNGKIKQEINQHGITPPPPKPFLCDGKQAEKHCSNYGDSNIRPDLCT